MSSLTTDKMFDLYTDLTTQIAKSVKKLEQKSNSLNNNFSAKSTEKASLRNNISFTGYSFSYIEPSSLYSLYQINADLDRQEQLNDGQKKQREILENEDSTYIIKDEDADEASAISFMDFLQNNTKIDAHIITEIYNKNSVKGYSSAPLMLNGGSFTTHDIKYANNLYNFTLNINNTPDTRIEYMYKNNRSFDYRI